MLSALIKEFKRDQRAIYMPAILVAAYLALIVIFLNGYFISDMMVWAGIVSIPYILRIDSQKGGTRYLWLAVVMLILTVISGVATFYFLSIGLAMLFVFESMAGRINWPPLFLLGLLCPAFKYFNNIFGFSVRLQLSEMAGKILNGIGLDVKVAGNVMMMNNCEFSVDPACVGLKMMAVTLLAGLLMIAFFERKNSKSFSFISVLLIMILVVILNILSNLFRIILLVIFRILPENPAHDMIGILCLIFYVFIPAYLVTQYISKLFVKKSKKPTNQQTPHLKFRLFINLILLVSLTFAGFQIKNISPTNSQTVSISSFKGYTKSVLNNDVTKLEKPGILIYVKSMKRFYGTEHNPMICWIGSGYEFKRINQKTIHGKQVYTGTLQKGNDVIYAAWWFDNGKYQTIDQFDWRWKAFNGEEFSLINVNSASENILEAEVGKLLKTRILLDDNKSSNN